MCENIINTSAVYGLFSRLFLEHPSDELIYSIMQFVDEDYLKNYVLEDLQCEFDTLFVIPSSKRILLTYSALMNSIKDENGIQIAKLHHWYFESVEIIDAYETYGFDYRAFIDNATYVLKPDFDSLSVFLKFISYLRYFQVRLNASSNTDKKALCDFIQMFNTVYVLPSINKARKLCDEECFYEHLLQLCEKCICYDLDLYSEG